MSGSSLAETGMWSPAGPVEPEELDQFLTLDLAGETFAVAVQQVREVLDLQRIARIANAPSLLLGMIHVRGAAIPVVDLSRKLGLPDTETTAHSRIVVLEVEGASRQLVVAAIADAVHEVTHLEADSVAPPPELGQPWDSSFMRGLGRRNGAFVTILEIGRLFRAGDINSLDLMH